MPNDVINKGFGKVQIHNYLSTWMLKLAFGIDWYIHYYSNGGSIREQADCYKSITSEDFFRTRDAVLSNSWNQPKCSVYYFELPKIHQGDGCEVAVFKESVVFKKGCHLIIMLRDGGLMYEFLNSENSQALLRKATDIDYEFAYYKLISCFRTYSILLHEFEWLDKKYLGRVFEEENAKDVYREEFALAYNASLVGTEFEEFNLGTEFSERKAIRDFIPNVFLKPCEFDYKHSKSWIERLFGG
jgi:hypothetical protein